MGAMIGRRRVACAPRSGLQDGGAHVAVIWMSRTAGVQEQAVERLASLIDEDGLGADSMIEPRDSEEFHYGVGIGHLAQKEKLAPIA